MNILRFSAAPAGRLYDRTIPWAIFGDRSSVPDGLEDNALAGANLASIAASPGAPMFEQTSLFGAHLAAASVDGASDAPAVIFVHGFQYEPRRPVLARIKSDNAHRCLYHFDETPGGPGSAEERRHHLTPLFARAFLKDGQGRSDDAAGLAIGYAYASRGGSTDPFLPGRFVRFALRNGWVARWRQPAPAYVNAYADAEHAGYGLAAVITQIRYRLDAEGLEGKPIDLLCHSLGARVVLSALAMLAQRWPGDPTLARIGRVILLNGACYWGQAAYALANILFADAPTPPSFYNVTSASDEVLDYLEARATMRQSIADAVRDLSLERSDTRLLRYGRTIGRSGKPPHQLYRIFGPDYPAWVDLPLDSQSVRRWGRRRGYDLRGRRRISRPTHGLSFTHPGNWALYRAILNREAGTEIEALARDIG